jgi:UDP-N-acetylglucosamine 2-epimerase (non-hydrolysing)
MDGFETLDFKRSQANYGVVTLHRPSNVDSPEVLQKILSALEIIARDLPLLFAMHPRTAANIAKFRMKIPSGIVLTGPLPFMEFLNLWKDARLLLTDSGGLQEETTALGIPCITLRENTERPVTVTNGTNQLVGSDPEKILATARAVIAGGGNADRRRPELWDGLAANRIVECLRRYFLERAG